MKNKLLIFITILIPLAIIGCGGDDEEDNVRFGDQEGIEHSSTRDQNIQRYNLEHERGLGGNRAECDTLSLVEFVLDSYPDGTYMVDFDKSLTYNVPKPAVLYYSQGGSRYAFGLIASSRPGERLIETKNIVGYDQSFIDLDSTKLGTAFFYLVLFECINGSWSIVWEAPVPSHGGFNKITMNTWRNKGTGFIEVNFHYARGIGHINYNYFFVDGLTSIPHLLMTYKGINFERTMANVNNDKFPDYYEHIFYDLGNRVYSPDSVAFVWQQEDSLYVNTRNKSQTRPY